MSETPDFAIPRNGGGDSTIPRFYMRPEHQTAASKEAGRPIFKDVEFVEIHVPGDRKTVVDTMVNDTHRARWPRQYEAFKAGMEAPVEGTVLDEWPGITRGQVEELRFAKVRTVEALAALTDSQLNATLSMGGFALREKAVRYLEQANGAAPAEKLAAENETLKATMGEMKAAMDAMKAEMARLSAQAANAPQT